MPDNLSFERFQRKHEEDPVTCLANEMQSIVFGAAEPIRPGEIVKAQIRRAWEALGRPPYWRVRAAWYGEAGCWSGEAVRDFEARDHKRRLKEKAAHEHAQHAAGALLALRDRYHASDDQDFHSEHLVAIDAALAAMGFDVGALDSANPAKAGQPRPASSLT